MLSLHDPALWYKSSHFLPQIFSYAGLMKTISAFFASVNQKTSVMQSVTCLNLYIVTVSFTLLTACSSSSRETYVLRSLRSAANHPGVPKRMKTAMPLHQALSRSEGTPVEDSQPSIKKALAARKETRAAALFPNCQPAITTAGR